MTSVFGGPGCGNGTPLTGDFIHRRVCSSQFWRLDVQDPGAWIWFLVRTLSLPGLQRALLLWPHLVERSLGHLHVRAQTLSDRDPTLMTSFNPDHLSKYGHSGGGAPI